MPVGKYAKTALEHLKLWPQVANKVAPAKDVRAGLALVERAESPLGIVYASDAVISDKVRVAGGSRFARQTRSGGTVAFMFF